MVHGKGNARSPAASSEQHRCGAVSGVVTLGVEALGMERPHLCLGHLGNNGLAHLPDITQAWTLSSGGTLPEHSRLQKASMVCIGKGWGEEEEVSALMDLKLYLIQLCT